MQPAAHSVLAQPRQLLREICSAESLQGEHSRSVTTVTMTALVVATAAALAPPALDGSLEP